MRIRGRDKFLRQYHTYIEQGRIIEDSPNYKGRWHELFGNDNPIYIEIGTGRGQFISQHAVQNPDINYIGIELEYLLLGRVGHKAEMAGAGKNLVVTPADATRLTDIFAPGEVSRIYLNFSDPWPKNRHTPRRLTHEGFLRLYRNVLKPDGAVHFKTDNRPLFEFSLNSFADDDWKLSKITLDLHNSQWAEGNIMTEYEQKFSEQGVPINRLEARPLPKLQTE
ncbi:tRNA (guanosine(46)-N7)-methyltransferase TrmB [Tumebacillus sp. ITR2]|uniref:tRNA (guanine-N(7)-)-methyltransferase n=1 Tax=Tumebacillus amylolyticus TaxID=2801339 RepID=A0ABS1J6Q2_9BACL|nr:tRNA (guanosine(46)-N7)-methyltransferase TrmB [Tumebacillus amylolyticus]MBL0385951.1 tRNA (guanosine(46)-N7)-methyltransferase TrmB [Tumebacillus amylolyticus]